MKINFKEATNLLEPAQIPACLTILMFFHDLSFYAMNCPSGAMSRRFPT
jgi:hypothetical protein